MTSGSVQRGSCPRHVLLAPEGAVHYPAFADLLPQPFSRDRLLEGVQLLRGRVFLENRFIARHELSIDGRHTSPLDHRAWHLVTANDQGDVVGCLRMIVHSANEPFDALFASHSAIAMSNEWGPAVRTAIERERATARDLGMTFLEVGGWALRETERHSLEAARLALGVFAFGQLIGGAIAITTATLQNQSASILRRIGGRPLQVHHCEIPVYYDPRHESQMEILRFDSSSVERKYASMIDHLRMELQCTPVFCKTVQVAA